MAGTALDDVTHYWGSDLQLSPTGDLSRSSRVERSKQRVLRRLMTNPGDYIWHPAYGAGLPALVGTNATAAAVQALVRGQMLLEASVARDPEPTVAVQTISNGLAVQITYAVPPEKQPVALSFSVSV